MKNKQIKKHSMTIAWDNWLMSDKAQPALAPGHIERQYLENRLYHAFKAGYESAEQDLTNEQED
jgi:hypothetical protein